MQAFRAVWLAVLLLLPAFASAQNLLASPDFDTAGDLAAWPDPFPDPSLTIGWEPPPMDVDGSDSSGALRLVTSITSGAADGPLQCVVSGPGLGYRAAGSVFAATQSPQPFPHLLLHYYASPDCSGSVLASDAEFPAPDLDTWKPIEFVVMTPPDTGSIGFRPLSGNTVEATPATAFFDALFLPEPANAGTVAVATIVLIAAGRRFAARRIRSGSRSLG